MSWSCHALSEIWRSALLKKNKDWHGKGYPNRAVFFNIVQKGGGEEEEERGEVKPMLSLVKNKDWLGKGCPNLPIVQFF